MSTTSHKTEPTEAGHGARRLAAVGLGTVLLLGGGALTAAAAPVTDPVGPGTSGTTAHGVTWTASDELRDAAGVVTNGFSVGRGEDAMLTFGETVDLTFDVVSLQSNGPSDTECLVLPAGSTPVQLSPMHEWNAASSTICATNNNAADDPAAANDATSQFRLDDVSSFSMSGNGTNTSRARWISNPRVTVDREEPAIPMVAPAFAVAGLVATGALAGVRRVRGLSR
ncbi:hypothetical protein [Promicromonospora sukumoe]|uniref:hypothetical protein n=1 Tax=Promicromonospora sukumoe TaxID=88382 RepID=UPI0003767FD5|nr:hypothetical protein [Promicromonospora sukumoe]